MVVEKIQIETSEIDLKDAQIFKAIFNMFYPRAYAFTLKLLRDEVVKSYLYSCLKNKTLNYIRDHRVERNMKELEDVFVDDVSIDHLVIEHELKARILEEINKLSDVKREIMLLRMKGYSYDEISEELSLSINTIKTHKKQAYKDLKIHLSDYKQCLLVLVSLFVACFCN